MSNIVGRYEAKQAMRRLETAVRDQKSIREAARNSGDKVLSNRCTEKIKAYQKKYNQISEITGIAPQPKRMSITKGLNTVKSIDFSENGGIINTEIDELTPCLRRLRDNKIIKTIVEPISPKSKDFSDWEFDWTIPEKQGYSVYCIKAEGDNRIQGIVAMKGDIANSAYRVDLVESAPFNNPHNKNFAKKEYSGVGGHLFAEAVKQSLKDGFGGAVYFTAKTDLIEHYKNELGAVLVNPKARTMFIDEEDALKLYRRYYGGTNGQP